MSRQVAGRKLDAAALPSLMTCAQKEHIGGLSAIIQDYLKPPSTTDACLFHEGLVIDEYTSNHPLINFTAAALGNTEFVTAGLWQRLDLDTAFTTAQIILSATVIIVCLFGPSHSRDTHKMPTNGKLQPHHAEISRRQSFKHNDLQGSH